MTVLVCSGCTRPRRPHQGKCSSSCIVCKVTVQGTILHCREYLVLTISVSGAAPKGNRRPSRPRWFKPGANSQPPSSSASNAPSSSRKMPSQPAPPPASSAAVHSFITSDPLAAEFLLSLLFTAAFSSRFATLLDPLPVVARYFHRTLQQPNIALLRADLLSLPSIPTLSRSPSSLSASFVPLLAHAFFHPSSTTPWLVSVGSSSHFPASEVTASRRAVRFRVCASRVIPAALSAGALFSAFHGSSPERWYSILRNGLLVQDQCGQANGRLFGDAAYLARSFTLAAAFAPHENAGKGGGIKAMSVVGEFDVAETAVKKGDDVPDGYVVVEDVAAIRLTGLSVLLERGREEEQLGCVEGMVQSLMRTVGGFGLVVIAYLIALLLAARK